MDLLLRTAFSSMIAHGSLEIVTASGRHMAFGDGTGTRVAVHFRDSAAQLAFLLNPALRLGEIYMDGRIEVVRGTIFDFAALVMGNRPNGRGLMAANALERLRARLRRLVSRNGAARAQCNVAHHYDLDGRLYELFLDSDMQYSCAYFESPLQSLEAAQVAKKRHLAAKLLVEPGMSVLDIGCGWGGLAIYLADVAQAEHVTGVTLSSEQLEVAVRRVAAHGLAKRVSIAMRDYRDVEGRFDRIVSVGMFEHVGPENYDTYFRTCADLLDENGVMVLHTIGASGTPGPTNPWITRYIFPGGHIPTMSEIVPSIERAGLRITDVEVLRLHYAQTLRLWRERFMARRDEALRLYDERFCRMWEFYLAGSEAAFRYEDLVVFQIQLARRNDVVPLTRGYVAEREAALLRLEDAPFEPAPSRHGTDRQAAADGASGSPTGARLW